MENHWRVVMRTIAGRLNASGIAYCVIGGASAALHGVNVEVCDLDLEMSASDASRFQELFLEKVSEPLRWCEGKGYRSHFGRFRFDTVLVEVIGDNQRWQDGAWVDTAACTRDWIDLDGTPVCVSWLEEETLAYIRRNRLERAALCLPHCSHERLLALIRGQVKTNVV